MEVTGELFGLEPGDFVAARNQLVKSLRKAGDREVAGRVADLRRPSPAAWAVNQLSRRRREELEGLVRLGQALRDAQEQALGGADAQLLRGAGRARRDAVAGLADVAVAMLAERGSGAEAHAAEIVATLDAASLDPQAGEAVLAGRLTSALDPPSGFGVGDAAVQAPRSPGRRPPAAADVDQRDGAEADRKERLERAERALADARELATRMDREASAARDRVAGHERDLERAEADLARLERELEEARGRADAASRELAEARRAQGRSEAAAADARQRVSDAEARVEALGP